MKLITQLQQKKYRNTHKLFIAEGSKVIEALLQSRFTLHSLFATTADAFVVASGQLQLVTEAELKKISRLTTPNKALALFGIPPPAAVQLNDLVVALDAVNDPGNLGTMIRLCDWFGVRYMVCGRETADCYNPKAVQASMGALARVDVVYTDLEAFLTGAGIPVFAATMQGRNIYTAKLPQKAILVLGNEANGISERILDLAGETLGIPNFSGAQQAESLNVATAAAVMLSEFRRRS